jgi:AraC-like DNA-binding protein
MSEYIRFHPFPLAGIEAMSASTGRSYPRHTHDQYGIGVIDSGGHASWSGRGQVEAGPGQFICLNPVEVHDGRAIDRLSRSWRILYFDPGRLEETRADVLEGAQSSAFTFASPVFPDEPLRRLFDVAFSLALTPSHSVPDDMASETAILSLTARLESHSTARTPHEHGPVACIRRAQSRMDGDPAAPVTLAELARESGLSRYQLLRAFARQLGLTPHAYLLQKRIALARRLIRSGHELSEAAVLAGFYDQSHMTRCFVRHLGITPRRYASRAA